MKRGQDLTSKPWPTDQTLDSYIEVPMCTHTHTHTWTYLSVNSMHRAAVRLGRRTDCPSKGYRVQVHDQRARGRLGGCRFNSQGMKRIPAVSRSTQAPHTPHPTPKRPPGQYNPLLHLPPPLFFLFFIPLLALLSPA